MALKIKSSLSTQVNSSLWLCIISKYFGTISSGLSKIIKYIGMFLHSIHLSSWGFIHTFFTFLAIIEDNLRELFICFSVAQKIVKSHFPSQSLVNIS
jgi:hypothetical protein